MTKINARPDAHPAIAAIYNAETVGEFDEKSADLLKLLAAEEPDLSEKDLQHWAKTLIRDESGHTIEEIRAQCV